MTKPPRKSSPPAQSPARIESFGFRAAEMEPEANAAAWREAVVSLFDVSELGRGEPGPFRADIESYAMGPVLLGHTRFSGQRFTRSLEVVARSGVDHLIVQLYLTGGFQGTAGGAPMAVGAGDICVFDLAQTLETVAVASEVLTIVAPRLLVERRLPQPELLHGLVLPGRNVLASLLGRHLITLFDHAGRMTYDECVMAAEGTVALAAACMQGELERRDAIVSAPHSLSLLEARRWIDQHLEDADLSADSVAEAFGMSRATLYRLFAPAGGVAEFIRARRLHRAFFDLADPAARVSEVARRWGFSSEAVFARAFKAAYGISPRAARGAASFGGRASGAEGMTEDGRPVIGRWMRELTGRGGDGQERGR